jgi:hypothetical protein
MEANERDVRRLTSSRSQTPHNTPNAALAGALTAFAKPRVGPKSNAVIKLQAESYGALSAAKSVDNRGYNPPPTPTLTRSLTGSSNNQLDVDKENSIIGKRKLTTDWSSAVSRPTTPAYLSTQSTPNSASFTAATLAAARHQRPGPTRTPSQTTPIEELPAFDPRAQAIQRRLAERMYARELDGSMGDDPRPENERTDSSSIVPTKSLVKMFEQNSAGDVGNRLNVTGQPSSVQGKPPPIVAPKPQRTISVKALSPELTLSDVSARPKTKPKPLTTPASNGILPPPKQITSTATGETVETSQLKKPSIPPPRRVVKNSTVNTRTTNAESVPPLSRYSPPKPASRPSSVSPQSHVYTSNIRRTSPAPYKDNSLNIISPHMTGDSLANAIVGANLAIKSTSPPKRSRTPPPLPTPRRKHNQHGHDIWPHQARSLSPQKKQPGRLLTTLRSDEVDEKQKNRKHHFRQPNKHHEGTRERWRDFVSEPERKRYEGVWAANKGVYVSSSSQADEVLDLVVRDIWSRSRLPSERLAKVWELVTQDENSSLDGRRKSLTRDQFVVGMWLIDQMLKGRNLPHNVHASVWESVRLRGVKVRLEGKGKDGRKLERGTAW